MRAIHSFGLLHTIIPTLADVGKNFDEAYRPRSAIIPVTSKGHPPSVMKRVGAFDYISSDIDCK